MCWTKIVNCLQDVLPQKIAATSRRSLLHFGTQTNSGLDGRRIFSWSWEFRYSWLVGNKVPVSWCPSVFVSEGLPKIGCPNWCIFEEMHHLFDAPRDEGKELPLQVDPKKNGDHYGNLVSNGTFRCGVPTAKKVSGRESFFLDGVVSFWTDTL